MRGRAPWQQILMDSGRLYRFISDEAGRTVDERSLGLKVEKDLGIEGRLE